MTESHDLNRSAEELAFIHRIMTESREKISMDGRSAIMWGVIVAIGMIATYLTALAGKDFGIGWLWMGMSFLGVAYTIFYERKVERFRPVHTLVGRVLGSVWAAVGSSIGIFISMVFLTNGMGREMALNPYFILPVTAILTSIGYFLSGKLTGLRWLEFVAGAWMLGAIGFMFFPSIHGLLVYAVMMILFHVVPGVILIRDKGRKSSLAAA